MSIHWPGMIKTSDMSRRSWPQTLGLDYDGHNMVFVVGCARSGTTWLQRLLSTHPKIRTGQESHVFDVHIGPQLRDWRKLAASKRGGVGLACYFTEEEFLRILRVYLLTLLEPMVSKLTPNELFLEKSPNHLIFLPEIFELLPRARAIHILRDARDVVSSLLSGDEWMAWWAPKSASQAADIWRRHMREYREALPSLPRKQIHEVRYEELSRSPIPVLRGCTDFLGLDWDAAEIAKAVDANLASKARAKGGGTAIPLFGEAARRSGRRTVVEPKGFIRRAEPGGWKDELSLHKKLRVWRVAHREMDEFDYHWPKPMRLAFSCVSKLVDLTKMALSPKGNRGRS